MKLYKFSPIENREQLFEAIKHTHFSCFELCKNAFGKYLPFQFTHITLFTKGERKGASFYGIPISSVEEFNNFNPRKINTQKESS